MKAVPLLKKSANYLNSFSISPELDARILLEHVTSLAAEDFIFKPDLEIPSELIVRYQELLVRRVQGEPVAKIVGKKAFWKDEFCVNHHTLDPRPDSEVIIEAILLTLSDKTYKYNFLELGVGSGCLIISLLKEYINASCVGVDISIEALKVAKRNAELLGVSNRLELKHQNWADGMTEKFDLIISNPPYIPTAEIDNLTDDVKKFDPMLALDGGQDGLDCYRYLAKQIKPLLKEDAFAILEFGHNQALYVGEIFKQHGYHVLKIFKDLGGRKRAIIVR